MVAAEEEPMETTPQTNENDVNDNNDNVNDGGATPKQNEDYENHNRHNTNPQEQNKHGTDKDKHKERSRHSSSHHHGEKSSNHSNDKHSKESNHMSRSRTSSGKDKEREKNKTDQKSSIDHHDHRDGSEKRKEEKHKMTTSSSGSTKSKHDDKHTSSSKDKERSDKHKSSSRDKERTKVEKSSSSLSKEKSEHKSSSAFTSKSATKDLPESLESRKRHNLDNDLIDFKSPQPKVAKLTHKSSTSSSSSKQETKPETSPQEGVDEEVAIDCFDILGKLDVSVKKAKKSLKSPSSNDKSEHKSSSACTSKSATKDPQESLERKRRHNSDNDSIDSKSVRHKVSKVSHKSSSSSSSSKQETKPENSPREGADEEAVDDCFDSSMGANFNDILGMLDVPIKKAKKSKSPSLTPSGSSRISKKETTTSRLSTSSSNSTHNKVNGVRTPFGANPSYSIPSTSKAAVTVKPDLLAPTAKLEPLDPSIVLDLPTISTNYKPMPLNQTVMDCVFNAASSSNSKPVRTLTDAEAITHGISSKTIRTKIYSGVRTGQTYQVPSLFDMCIRILQKNIDALEYTGGVPFEVLKPVLDRCSPQQLYNFEEYNPYIIEDSDGLWQVHVQRNHRAKKREENESWREMFMRCQVEEEQKLSILKNNIKASQKIAAAPIRKTQLAFVDSLVKPPRSVQRKQEQYGTKSKMVATPASRVASLQSVTPNAAKTGDQRLKVTAPVREHVHTNPVVRNKKAPLMAKTLQFIKGRLKR